MREVEATHAGEGVSASRAAKILRTSNQSILKLAALGRIRLSQTPAGRLFYSKRDVEALIPEFEKMRAGLREFGHLPLANDKTRTSGPCVGG